MGMRTLLVVDAVSSIAKMPCNPSIGGLAKSHLVYELDALGGEMGFNADRTSLQQKTLNMSRGPAVRATRAQCDKTMYASRMQNTVREQPNLTVIEDMAIGILTENSNRRHATGIETAIHGPITARAIVLACGTSLRGKTFIGFDAKDSGGDGRPACTSLSKSLESLGFALTRLKTGTPPRLKASSCDFSACTELKGESPPPLFSLKSKCSTWNIADPKAPENNCSTWNNSSSQTPSAHDCSTWNIPNISCWESHTTPKTHSIIISHLKDSALYGGPITGTGVRYCPSIEDKVVRFKNANRHHVILEPEALDGEVIYPNGLSCSLPAQVQEEMVRSVPGLEHAEFLKYAYAIEYDGIDARELKHTLESKRIGNLFVAFIPAMKRLPRKE